MPPILQLGPLVLSTTALLLFVAIAAGLAVARQVGKKTGGDATRWLWRIVVVAVLAARVAFVWQYREGYLASPWSMLNLRDGGWEPQAGLVAAWFAALWVGRAHPGLRKPLAAGVGLASVIWLATLVALALPSNDDVRLQAMAQPTLPTLDGKAAALADFKGRPTVVNLWATWCPPCRNEMPVLQQAQAAHADLHFVFLNQGETADKVRGFVAATSLQLQNVLLDGKGLASRPLSPGVLPKTLFFDAEGRLVHTHLGELSHAVLAAQIEQLRRAK